MRPNSIKLGRFPTRPSNIITMKHTIPFLIEQLSRQLQQAFDLDGVWGEEAFKARRAACEAANATIEQIEKLGMDGEEALEKAEALAFPCNRA